MKNLTLILILLVGSFVANAQSNTKNQTITFKVYGNCGMCKKRIESAALDVKGVKKAIWNNETKIITIVYDPVKTDELTVHEAIADVGHDTEKVTASDKAYGNLHGCCKYDRKTTTNDKGHNCKDKKKGCCKS